MEILETIVKYVLKALVYTFVILAVLYPVLGLLNWSVPLIGFGHWIFNALVYFVVLFGVVCLTVKALDCFFVVFAKLVQELREYFKK